MTRPVHVLAPLVLAAFAANGHAQDVVRGALTGEVVDAGDVPLSGTTVTITGSAVPTGLRSTVTDASGTYQFSGLPPGTYEVVFALQGFTRRIVEGVAVPAGTKIGLTGRLMPGRIEDRQSVASDAVPLGAVETGEPQPDPSVDAGVGSETSTVDDADVAPQRLVTVLPRYPRDAPRGTAGTISVTLNVDAAGRPFNVQPAPEHDIIGLRDVDGTLAAALEPGPAFRAAVVDAVSQWVYAPPMREGTTVLARIAFLAGGRVRLVTHRVVQPVQTTSTVSSAPR